MEIGTIKTWHLKERIKSLEVELEQVRKERVKSLEVELEQVRNELKNLPRISPCPHCGKVGRIISSYDDDDYDHSKNESFAVNCDATIGGCGATGGYAPTVHDAAEKWNKRTDKE